ncbi:hypothetical protein ACU8KH_00022 [Lachancea thermotolerans]
MTHNAFSKRLENETICWNRYGARPSIISCWSLCFVALFTTAATKVMYRLTKN